MNFEHKMPTCVRPTVRRKEKKTVRISLFISKRRKPLLMPFIFTKIENFNPRKKFSGGSLLFSKQVDVVLPLLVSQSASLPLSTGARFHGRLPPNSGDPTRS